MEEKDKNEIKKMIEEIIEKQTSEIIAKVEIIVSKKTANTKEGVNKKTEDVKEEIIDVIEDNAVPPKVKKLMKGMWDNDVN